MMVAVARRRPPLAALTFLLLTGACGGPSAAPRPGPAPATHTPPDTTPRTWHRAIAPFQVLDDHGAAYPLPFLGGFDHPRPQLVDLGGTGHPDLFVQEYTGELARFTRAPGDTLAWTWATDRYQGLDIGEWYRFADVDGDGLPDLFAESRYSYIRYFHNTGTRDAPRFTVVADTLKDVDGTPIYADRQNIAQFVDLDCNGRMDLMLGRVDGTIARYELVRFDSAGAPRFRLVTDRFEDIQIIGQRASRHGANTLAIADIDRDGDPDILWGDFFEPGLLWLRNIGSCAKPDFHSDRIPFPPDLPLETSGYNAPAFGPLAGHDSLDLIVGVLGGAFNPVKTSRENLYRLDHTGPGRWTVRTSHLLYGIDLGSESVPAVGDLDGDGDLDLVVGTKIDPDDIHRGALYWFENTGTPAAPSFVLRGKLPVAPAFHYAPALGDLDGDGKPEMILGQFHDALSLYRFEKGPNGPVPVLVDSAIARLPHGSNAVPTLADFDGDGDLDLFVGESSGRILYFENQGTAGTPRFKLITDDFLGERLGRRVAPRFADLFGDGRLSLIVGTERGAPVIYRRGQGSGPALVRDTTLTFPLPPYSTPLMVNLEGPGRPAILSGGAGGGLVYLQFGAGAPNPR